MIVVNNPGPSGSVFPQLLHANWHGWTFTDCVFPFFLWIVGLSLTLSFAKRTQSGTARASLLRHVAMRAALLIVIGWLMALIPSFDFAHLRIPGVLPRIGVCYFFAALAYLYCSTRTRVYLTAALLAIYWALMKLYPVPGFGPGHLEVPGNFAWYVDGLLLSGHMYSQTITWDPEGIVSTLPAIATTLLGTFAGELLRRTSDLARRTAWLSFSGSLLTLTGLLLSGLLPINKPLWTTTYTLLMAGLASLAFAATIWLTDELGWRRLSPPLEAFGRNALLMFVLSGMAAKFLSILGWQQPLYQTLSAPIPVPELASLAYALSFTACHFVLAWWLYRRGWIWRV